MTFDLDKVISMIFFAGSVIMFYWKNKNDTDKTLTKFGTKIDSLEKEVNWIDEAREKFSSFESQLSSLCKLFDDLKPLLEKQVGIDFRLKQIEDQLEKMKQQLDELSRSVAHIQTSPAIRRKSTKKANV